MRRNCVNGPYKFMLMVTVKQEQVCYPNAGLERRFGLQEIEASEISRRWTHEGGKVVRSAHRPPLPPPPSRCSWYSFLVDSKIRRTVKCNVYDIKNYLFLTLLQKRRSDGCAIIAYWFVSGRQLGRILLFNLTVDCTLGALAVFTIQHT